MSIATRRGDQGETDLLFGTRISKTHPRVRLLGDVDELNAALGLVRAHAGTPETGEICQQVQEWLIALMGEIATPPGEEGRYQETHPQQIGGDQVQWLDDWVARIETEGAFRFEGWVLPGAKGSVAGAQADFARTVCRRGERTLLELRETDLSVPNPELAPFLNRLSDLLWLMARWEERDL